MTRKMNNRFPNYPDDADYTTNAPSYYDDLARKQKLIKMLAEKIWEYDEILKTSLEEVEAVLNQVIDKIGEGFNQEIYELLIQWVEDGTLDHIINETLMNKKADKTELQALETALNDAMTLLETTLINQMNQLETDTNNNITQLETTTNDKMKNIVKSVNDNFIDLHLNKNKTYELIAHRGFRALAPENTMTAFTSAIQNGADSLECDVQFTSDNVPVIIHDATVDRTSNSKGNVNSFTLNSIQLLSNNKSFSDEGLFNSARIPTLEEFLIFSKGKAKKVYVELKFSPSNSQIKSVIDLIKLYGMEEMTIIQSFTFSHLTTVRKYSTNVYFGYLSNSEPSASQYNEMENDSRCYFLGNKSVFLTNPSVYNKCIDRKINVGAWTVNEFDEVNRLLEIGVTNIMSDYALKGVN